MARKSVIYVKIVGNSILEQFKAVSHEIVGLPACTYHKFELEDGVTLFINDFGIRTLAIADSPEALS